MRVQALYQLSTKLNQEKNNVVEGDGNGDDEKDEK